MSVFICFLWLCGVFCPFLLTNMTTFTYRTTAQATPHSRPQGAGLRLRISSSARCTDGAISQPGSRNCPAKAVRQLERPREPTSNHPNDRKGLSRRCRFFNDRILGEVCRHLSDIARSIILCPIKKRGTNCKDLAENPLAAELWGYLRLRATSNSFDTWCRSGPIPEMWRAIRKRCKDMV